MREEEEETTMDIMEDELVNEESLYHNIVDRLDENKKTDALFLGSKLIV